MNWLVIVFQFFITLIRNPVNKTVVEIKLCFWVTFYIHFLHEIEFRQ